MRVDVSKHDKQMNCNTLVATPHTPFPIIDAPMYFPLQPIAPKSPRQDVCATELKPPRDSLEDGYR